MISQNVKDLFSSMGGKFLEDLASRQQLWLISAVLTGIITKENRLR
jgi:hypothetical protein